MKLIAYVFSGTGNTRRVCEALLEEAKCHGVESEIYAVRKGETPPAPEGFDGVILGYPVHAFNAPAALLKFIKKMPKRKKGERLPVWLVRSSGEPLRLNDASGILPARRLKRRGYAVKGEFSYIMPYNIIFRHSDKMAARMWRANCNLIERDAQTLASGEGSRPRVGLLRRFVSFVLRIEHIAMPVLGKCFRANKKKCIGCGKCANVCPQGNIIMKDGKPKFGGSCVGCMGCAFSCPTDAIRTSLLNGWRVNGAYSFGGDPASDAEVCDYCKKAYLRFFHEAEKS